MGKDKVDYYEKLINIRIGEYKEECLEKDQMTGGWISSVRLKPEKRKNQTCYLITKGMTRYNSAENFEKINFFLRGYFFENFFLRYLI